LSWAGPSAVSLATGTRGTLHVYACNAELWETDIAAADPLSKWNTIPIHDSGDVALDVRFIHDVAVISHRST
jgi:hypothetical protein